MVSSQILDDLPSNLTHMATPVVEKIRGIITAVKEHDIATTFREGRNLCDLKDPSSDLKWKRSDLHTFYSDISILFEGLSVECHTSILIYYLFLFMKSASNRMNGV